MGESIVVIEGVGIDQEKVKRLLRKLILREKMNLKTREKSDAQMVRDIQRMIEEEVQCY